MHYFIENLTAKYFQFSGRASRAEFWWFILCAIGTNIAFMLVLAVIGNVTGTLAEVQNAAQTEMMISVATTHSVFFGIFLFLFLIWQIYIIIPTLAVTTRRLHDSSISGWWVAAYILITLFAYLWIYPEVSSWIAGLLSIAIFIFTLFKGDAQANKYGNP